MRPSRLPVSQGKFCPKNPVTKVSGRNTVARTSAAPSWRLPDRQPGLLDGDDCHVGLEDGREQVALRRHLLVDERRKSCTSCK